MEVLLERYRVLSIKIEPFGTQSNLQLHPACLFISQSGIPFTYGQKGAKTFCIKIKKKMQAWGSFFFYFPQTEHQLEFIATPHTNPHITLGWGLGRSMQKAKATI